MIFFLKGKKKLITFVKEKKLFTEVVSLKNN